MRVELTPPTEPIVTDVEIEHLWQRPGAVWHEATVRRGGTDVGTFYFRPEHLGTLRPGRYRVTWEPLDEGEPKP